MASARAGGVPETIRTLIADDHAIFRYGLRRLLESEPGIEVVGEAADGREAVSLAGALQPDVVLLDLAMPRLSGLQALRELGRGPARILVLTAGADQRELVAAFELGARGVVMKAAAVELLRQAIRAVVEGQYWVGEAAGANLPQAMTKPASEAERQDFRLTPRERDVVTAVVAGCSNREIGRRLSVTEDTVKHHLSSVFDKTGTSTRLELAVLAIHHGLVE